MSDTMKIHATTVPVSVDVTVTVETMIEALKNKCGVYENHNNYYKTENGKLYKCTDISYHGSPRYETELISENEDVVAMYEAITAFEKAYKNHMQQ